MSSRTVSWFAYVLYVFRSLFSKIVAPYCNCVLPDFFLLYRLARLYIGLVFYSYTCSHSPLDSL